MLGQLKECLIASGAKMLRLISLLVCASLCTASGSPKFEVGQQPQTAKQKAPPTPGTGEVNGFVFLITQGGDLKPARLAAVTLLYNTEQGSATAGSTFTNYQGVELSKRAAMLTKEIETKNFETPEARCLESMQVYVGALKSTLKWVTENKKTSQLLTVDADEEGHFKVVGVPVGRYTVTVYGRAGANQAFWVQDNIEVTTDHDTSIKMTTPEEACVLL